jgi:two-component system chemotaxis response regulator CheB
MKSLIRVLVVDDSAFMRYTISKHLEADPNITVIGSARDGLDALVKIPALRPDVVTLDVEMPRMDGLDTLKRIMAECPLPVVMLSSLTRRGARTTVKALMRGAVDFVPKPAGTADIQCVVQELIVKIKLAAQSNGAQAPASPESLRDTSIPETDATADEPSQVKSGLRPFKNADPVIVIGASTGGPRALQKLLAALPGNLPAALAVVQHMPPGFTQSLAYRLNETCAITVQEASNGDRLALGLALLAPGDFHLRFKHGRQVLLDQGPRCHHVRPSVDVTMESAAELFGRSVIGVVLTGMGADGTAGARRIKEMGGRVIAEDETTSVVYGMPRCVFEAGLTDQVAPLPELASILVELVGYGRD